MTKLLLTYLLEITTIKSLNLKHVWQSKIFLIASSYLFHSYYKCLLPTTHHLRTSQLQFSVLAALITYSESPDSGD